MTRLRPKVASLADAAIRELVTAHPETWFTPGQVVRELERNIRPLYLTNGRAPLALSMALGAAAVAVALWGLLTEVNNANR